IFLFRFLLQCLDTSLRKLNSRLFVIRGQPADVFPRLFKVFDELLLDADWSVNADSWMWLSCSSFFQQFFHCYCPVGFGRRTDPMEIMLGKCLFSIKF
uniref:Cryptochrome/DNA photolyase FAD-binding domain-containing protein n=1 Tax=Callorhinchus milii TaxID=7868 RepID=A0A4W3JNX9_CALMI